MALDVSTAVPASMPLTVSLAGELAADRNDGLVDFLVPSTTTPVSTTLNTRFEGLVPDGIAVVLANGPGSVFDLVVQLDAGGGGTVTGVVGVANAVLLPVPLGLDPACPLHDDVEGSSDCDGDGVEDGVDDDDDGDGVADATEPSACVGVGRGVDDDGDCLCGIADPVPGCATNDPTACTPATAIVCD